MKLPIPPAQLKKRLVQDNLIAPERFDEMLGDADRKNQDLTDILVSERVVDQGYLNGVIAAALGVPLANLSQRQINEAVLRTLSEDIARQRRVIIFDQEPDGTIDAAMADPSDLETMEFLGQRLGTRIKPFLATMDDLRRGFSLYGSWSTEDFKKIIEENIQASLRNDEKPLAEAAAEMPIVSLVNSILSYAISLRASDIHLEILEETVLIRYRIDGVLYEVVRVPRAVHPALITRIKLLSGLKLDEHVEPQDGRFHYQLADQVVDVRVAVMPTAFGEKIVLRLLEGSQKPLSLEELGMLPRVAEVVRANLKKAYGMVLVCGPTGSGKSTTLYALMNILNQPSVNIVTVEDPIEYNMRYVNQTQINPEAGITFAEALKAFLRQDPNVIMVGEIRDPETASISIQAALTGHLLMSSLHTNDAPTAVPRLFDLQAPPFLVASTLNIILAQRLVRRICPSCIYSYEPGADVLKTISDEFARAAATSVAATAAPKLLYRGKGCSSCAGTGYRGRLGIYEALEVTEKVKEVVSAPSFTLERLKETIRGEGFKTMFEDGIEKTELALTTIEEVLRVIRE